MRREYIKPDFKMIKFNAADDVLTTSTVVTKAEPETFTSAESLGQFSAENLSLTD